MFYRSAMGIYACKYMWIILLGMLPVGCMHAKNGAIRGMRSKTDRNYEYRAMLSEVKRNLTRCYRAVTDYYDKTRTLKDGKKVTSVLPPLMKEPICTGGLTFYDIDSHPRYYEDSIWTGKGSVLKEIGLTIRGKSRACYMVSSESPGAKPMPGQVFTCHAWTNFDDDDAPAHWYRIGVYLEHCDCFRVFGMAHDPSSDDW